VTGWLLDTNVLSELRRPKPERKVLEFVGGQPLDLLYVSAITLADNRALPRPHRRHPRRERLSESARPRAQSVARHAADAIKRGI
jgi:predicted nucleic acid-binding protein